MTYLIIEISLWMLMAFVLGLIVGWLLEHFRARVMLRFKEGSFRERLGKMEREVNALQAQLDAAENRPSSAQQAPVPPVFHRPAPKSQGEAEAPLPPVRHQRSEDEVASVASAFRATSLTSQRQGEQSLTLLSTEISESQRLQLRRMNYRTLADLAHVLENVDALEDIAAKLAVEVDQAREWCVIAELMQLDGMDVDVAKQLSGLKISRLRDLAQEKPSWMAKQLNDKLAAEGWSMAFSEDSMAEWISQAKNLASRATA